MRLAHAIAVAITAGALAGCSLAAPSDQQLMGGDKQASVDGGARDSGDGGDGSADAADGGDGGCTPSGQRCNSTAECCGGLTCLGHSCR